MKRLLLAAVLGLGTFGAADTVYASQYISRWWQGHFYCSIQGSADRLDIVYWMEDRPNTRCFNDGTCMTSGSIFTPRASVRMTRWTRDWPGEYVVDHGNYITFYFMGDNKHFVWLHRPRRYGRHLSRFARGEYYFGEGRWNISCRRIR
jgi:hypothetical protein